MKAACEGQVGLEELGFKFLNARDGFELATTAFSNRDIVRIK